LMCVAFAIPMAAAVLELAPVAVLLVLFAISIAAAPVRTAFTTSAAPPLVRALKRVAMAELAYALLFSLGLLL
jgi:1,4-dihydroxy-2-naphthoate octaprenyltransferase